MDVPLYAIALVMFSVLYLAIGVYLAYVLIITLLVMFTYLTLRHGKLPDNYPHGLGDTMITVIFIGVTWGIFTYLAPKTPIPFVGSGLTYTHGQIELLPLIAITLVLVVVFLTIGAFIAKDLQGPGASVGGSANASAASSENKPKQGVGA
ncbi:MAG TPA: hypothetical protein VIZ68_02800 [Thermoplasmata archaeon]